MRAQLTIIFTAAVLHGCTTAYSQNQDTVGSAQAYDENIPASSQLREEDAMAVPDHTSDINTGELRYCLSTEADVQDVFEKLNRKDALITQEHQKYERITRRMAQLQADARNNQSAASAFQALEQQRRVQVTRVLSLFRDREAIFTRKGFLDADLADRCAGKTFTNSDLRSACQGHEARRSFRCNMRF